MMKIKYLHSIYCLLIQPFIFLHQINRAITTLANFTDQLKWTTISSLGRRWGFLWPRGRCPNRWGCDRDMPFGQCVRHRDSYWRMDIGGHGGRRCIAASPAASTTPSWWSPRQTSKVRLNENMAAAEVLLQTVARKNETSPASSSLENPL